MAGRAGARGARLAPDWILGCIVERKKIAVNSDFPNRMVLLFGKIKPFDSVPAVIY